MKTAAKSAFWLLFFAWGTFHAASSGYDVIAVFFGVFTAFEAYNAYEIFIHRSF